MSFVFSPIPQAAVPVVGSEALFPVHRIYCVGRNYAEHAKEMGASGREEPFFFMKPADAILPVPPGATVDLPYPPMTKDMHHEVELVAALVKGGVNIAVDDAPNHVFGYAVGLDMTRRDLQAEAKKLGRPWDTGKGFDRSAPIGPIHPAQQAGQLAQASIRLQVNGSVRQQGKVADMIWNVAEVISYLSRYFQLQPGDLIFTGTPAGVGAVARGDVLTAGIDDLGELQVKIV